MHNRFIFQLHKIRQYRKVGDGTEDVLDEIDEENGNGLPKPTAKIVDKVDIVKGRQKFLNLQLN